MESPSPAASVDDAARIRFTAARREFWDGFAENIERWNRFRSGYQRRLAKVYRFLIPEGASVLELGCGTGDLLAALKPSIGVGVDISEAMIRRARAAHPELQFRAADALDFRSGARFDYVVCADLVNDLWDAQILFERIREHSHADTRVILNFYNYLWELPRQAAETFGIARRLLPQNWLTHGDLNHLAYLAGFETMRDFTDVLWPFPAPVIEAACNRYLVKLWPFSLFGITNFLIARPAPETRPGPEPVVSVIVPARNEEGNIAHILDRVPRMGGGTELIFVEGNSRDGTWNAIEREIARRPGIRARLFHQGGTGKGDAVREGFEQASGDVFIILDADLSVAPEDLPRFYRAWRSGKADVVNGVRLVYPMERGAMRFFNKVGNKLFSHAFSWLLGQPVRDTLCGTKLIGRRHYRLIAGTRDYFGDFDPFGDFDLLFGAARRALRIVDVPVRYRERTYGATNIQRWRHGLILLRMVAFALRRIKFV